MWNNFPQLDIRRLFAILNRKPPWRSGGGSDPGKFELARATGEKRPRVSAAGFKGKFELVRTTEELCPFFSKFSLASFFWVFLGRTGLRHRGLRQS